MMMRASLGIMVWQTFVQLLMPGMLVNGQCEYRQYMELGIAYYVYNTEYPYPYTRGTSCKWIATSPVNSKIYLSCEEVNIPQSQNCYNERLTVSLSGNEQLSDGHNYCGNGTLSLVSSSNAMTIGLFADYYYARGGRVMCTITAIAVTPPVTERPARCDCGQRFEKRIVGGVETGINEFPFMAGIVNSQTKQVICGATIISKRYSVTAAHCMANIDLTKIALLVGDHDLSTGSDTAEASLYIFENYYIHERFNNITYANDIALMKTVSDIRFSDRVGAVCLPFTFANYDLEGATVTLTGWGTLEFSGTRPNTLQKVDVEVQSNTKCKSNWATGISDSQMCTYTPGKDACQFDSGGPALYEDLSIRRLFLSGIISYGNACASNYFAVNTRVSSFLDWIIQHTGNTTYCIR